MGKWWKFGLGGGKDREEDPAPETPAPAPAPAPAPPPPPPPAPEPPAPKKEKKRGLLGRLFGRKKKEEAPPEEPPAAPAPPAPPAPPSTGGGAGGGDGGEGGEEGGEEAKEPERVFPNSVSARVDGSWVISESLWHGVIRGTLHGADAKAFILAIERGQSHSAIRLLADAYDDDDMGFARYLNIPDSSWGEIEY